MSLDPAGGLRRFIEANTALLPVPLVPEVSLHLAAESLALWQRTEEELSALGLPPPFWAFAWAGGQALARYVLDNGHVPQGGHVLDIGSGSGLAAIAAALAGADETMVTEIDDFAIEAIALNAAANGVEITVRKADVLGETGRLADLVLVGDLFYEQPLGARMLSFLERQQGLGARVLIGDPGRSYLPKERLERIASYQVPVSRELEDREIRDTGVWELAKAA